MTDGHGRAGTMLEKALAIAAVTVPVATAIIASGFANASARREANVRLIELAIGILQSEPTPATRDVRAWAVEVIDKYSDVDISKETKGALADSVRLSSVPSFSAQGGTISPTGIYVAGTAEGRYPLVVCLQDGRMCDTSWVTIVRPDTAKK